MEEFILVQSDLFAPLPGEQSEMVNDGMFGKALGLYLQAALQQRGYAVPAVYSEDWGWMVEVSAPGLRSGICIYSPPEDSAPMQYACLCEPGNNALQDELLAIFRADAAVHILGVFDSLPF